MTTRTEPGMSDDTTVYACFLDGPLARLDVQHWPQPEPWPAIAVYGSHGWSRYVLDHCETTDGRDIAWYRWQPREDRR